MTSPGYSSILICVAFLGCFAAPCYSQQPFADVHVHFNWDQKEIISADEIVARMRRAGIAFSIVTSTPSELALEMKQAGGDLVIPFYSPYTHALGRQDWYLKQETVERAAAGLREGLYRGIGEVHFMVGFKPATDNLVFRQLLGLAEEYRVPVLIHVDAGSEKKFLAVCRQHPRVAFIFAHAGGNLNPRHIRTVIEQCENVMVEFSARDPWRYGGLTGDDGLLLDGWRELVLAFPDRFVVGTDPVWKVTRTQSWDQADEGWDYFEQLLSYHRHWIADLPPAVQRKLSLDNARRLFGIR
ncbi:MAG: amidohydrolase family protein [Gammaproteobacteria bacterium]|nr:MAG: amidohydrolase family protein [Gammaproteobacteria bacterium]